MSIVRNLVSALALTAMLGASAALSAAPASAESKSTIWEKTSRGWEVSAWDDGKCSTSRRYEDGVYFMLGYRLDAKAFWVGFGKDAWGKFLKNDDTYDVTFETDGRAWSGGEFTGSVNPKNGHGALLSNGTLTWDFVEALAKANTVRFKVNGKTVLTLMLDGSYEALVKTMQCQKAQGERPSDKPQAESTPTTPSAPRITRF